jgi:glycosyltransferase involved in cell wall biosynthesis
VPVFRQAGFLTRALESLAAPSVEDWECIVVDDGSPDNVPAVVGPFLADPRFRLRCLDRNYGLGTALNAGIDEAAARCIAYLPADDLYYREHLETLLDTLSTAPSCILAYAGLRHHYGRETADGPPPGRCLQLVQVMHRRAPVRWSERLEIVTDNHDRLYWRQLYARGEFHPSGRVNGSTIPNSATR